MYTFTRSVLQWSIISIFVSTDCRVLTDHGGGGKLQNLNSYDVVIGDVAVPARFASFALVLWGAGKESFRTFLKGKLRSFRVTSEFLIRQAERASAESALMLFLWIENTVKGDFVCGNSIPKITIFKLWRFQAMHFVLVANVIFWIFQ